MINFVVTVGGAFAFGYKGVEVATGSKMFPVVGTLRCNKLFLW